MIRKIKQDLKKSPEAGVLNLQSCFSSSGDNLFFILFFTLFFTVFFIFLFQISLFLFQISLSIFQISLFIFQISLFIFQISLFNFNFMLVWPNNKSQKEAQTSS